MSEPHLRALTLLFFNVNRAMDSGRVATIDEAYDAVSQGRAMEFLDQYDEIELSSFKDDSSDVHDWEAMNAMLERYVQDPHDLSVENNGLAFVTAQIVEIIKSGPWQDPETGNTVDVGSLEIERDW